MLDINGAELKEGGHAQLLCEVVEITDEGVTVRFMNATEHYFVDARTDEVLGGLVASSELIAFVPEIDLTKFREVPCDHEQPCGWKHWEAIPEDADGVKQCPME